MMNRVFVTMGIALLLLIPRVWGWGEPHRTISRAVIETLPEWQRELVKDEIKDYGYTYCLYPDSAPDDPVTKPYVMPGAGIRMHLSRSRVQNQEILDYTVLCISQDKVDPADAAALPTTVNLSLRASNPRSNLGLT